ncbi:PAS domain-containing protein [Aminobacter sp. AP02]|uniref:PAS domain-containing sensor histidine kinase n=1 Tax=Aminobacter sp. AP02 TaxID=2135737 RepID=UPI000D6A91AC|nr:PAS domain-containing protein [Aminobacter sp. AP02]PWK69934.1 PAS domain S-box-containing protein [Aminobacter sp. AP02]
MLGLGAAAPEELHLAFLSGGGEVGQLIGALEWERTSLGPIQKWSQGLKSTISLILRSPVPIVTLWGEDGVMIYNDAYSVFADRRHPQILGSKVREGWPEVAHFNDHVMKVVLAGGTLAYRDQELTLNRSGNAEQVWMNLDYSPILDDDGRPAGVIAIVVETTAKVAAERWRKSELDRQRQMFEQAPGFIAMLAGRDHVFELTNAAYRQLIGHRDVLGMTVRHALPEVDGQGFIDLLDRVYATGEPFIGSSVKASLQRAPGAAQEERLIDFVYQPVRNPNGDVVGVFVQGNDVTERLVAETALRNSEAQFRTFAEAMPNHVWTASAEGQLTWFNPRVYEYSGAVGGELDGDRWAKIVHPEDVENAAKHWETAIREGVFYETEFRLRRHDGVFRWHIARAVPILDQHGSRLQWIGTNTDIDDQKSDAQALAVSERRLQLSQSAAGIVALEVDIASGHVFGSDGFWDLWGLSPRPYAHVGDLEDIVLDSDRDVRSNAETRKQGTAAANVEYRIRRPDTGELRWVSRHIDFVRDAAGKPIKMFGIMQDITERKEAEARQEMLKYELEHRIKNILAMVGAIASQTLRNAESVETARSAFNERLRAIADVHDLLNDTRWTNASMAKVVEGAIAAFPTGQITTSGPAISINPKMALTLALAVNELGTNSLKYGALSVPGGRVTIEWSIAKPPSRAENPTFVWKWSETGGPKVVAPDRKGFGTFLIERVFGIDFGGAVQHTFNPDGLECVLTAPLPSNDRPPTRYA